jgi:hypothetical protein
MIFLISNANMVCIRLKMCMSNMNTYATFTHRFQSVQNSCVYNSTFSYLLIVGNRLLYNQIEIEYKENPYLSKFFLELVDRSFVETITFVLLSQP